MEGELPLHFRWLSLLFLVLEHTGIKPLSTQFPARSKVVYEPELSFVLLESPSVSFSLNQIEMGAVRQPTGVHVVFHREV